MSAISAIRNQNEQLISSTNTGTPNWSYISTKSTSAKTQTEFANEIQELARKAASATSKTEQDSINRKLITLRAEYLSDVAPDRKAMYASAEKVMKGNSKAINPKCKGIGGLTLLDFLENSVNDINLTTKHTALAGGVTFNRPIETTGGNGATITYQGVNILDKTSAGWSYEMTPAEQSKKEEFYAIYWKEYRSSKAASGQEQKEIPDYLDENKASFDMRS